VVSAVNSAGESANSAQVSAKPTAPSIAFVQENYSDPQSPTSPVTVAYTSAQVAGHMNIVAMSWADTTSTVSSVTDSQGNTYHLAIGPGTSGGDSACIYYASNVKAGSDTVTVTFSQAVPYPDVRILEYAGVGTLDKTTQASGTGTAMDSGPVTTTVVNELIFGANVLSGVTTAAGSGFTSRVISSPDGEFAEDRIVSATGSYDATGTNTGGTWLMQEATFD
jgi:hypothetical protein